jgi:hypothetical protein
MISKWYFLIIFVVVHNTNTSRRPISLIKARKTIVDYYESGPFCHDVCHSIQKAYKHFSKRKIGPHDAIIFDVDDTSLLHYYLEKSVDFGFVEAIARQWFARADATPLYPVLTLYKKLKRLGYHLFFITGRPPSLYQPTIHNFNSVGFTDFDGIFMKTKNSQQTIGLYKEISRACLVAQGFTIIGSVGDQESDLTGCHVGYKVKIPNYIYKLD